MRTSLGVGLVALAFVLCAPSAHAGPTKEECIDANAHGQDLRREGKLTAARAAFAACAAEACPRIVKSDCTKRLDETDTAQPTIAFEVKDASGADVAQVTWTIDGATVSSPNAGTAIAVDPGKHEVTLAAPGLVPSTRTIVITEGEKGRREKIVLLAPATPVSREVPRVAGTVREGAPASNTQRTLGFVSSGVGVAGLAVGGIFGAFALSKKSQQQTDCATGPTCANHAAAVSDHSTGTTDALVSTVGFIAGGALLAGGLALVFTAKPGDDGHEATPRAVSLVPSVGPGGGGMLVQGQF